jgi:NAD(P)-dependent dehydrogenase (short-subunit alcohol dehydrogenase family)
MATLPSRFDLTGRVAVVLGGTSGLGLAIAKGFAESGADVVPTGRRAPLVEEAAAAIESLGRKTLRHQTDATDRAALKQLRDAVMERFGRVDILVNSTGRTIKKPTIQVTDDEWLSVTQSIVDATVRACQVFYEPLKQTGHGRIINIASLGSYLAFEGVAPYCAAKSAVLSLTRSLGCEWARHGICVNAIAPGVFPTELNAELLDGTERGKEIILRTPMRRFGNPEELVGVALLLASDASSFITGQCITVDGGYLASGVNS